jgi:hypothetical protein
MFGRFRCWLTRRHLTALADGELPRWRACRVSRHLECCAACASFYAAIRGSVKIQSDLLRHAVDATVRPDVVRMLHQVRGRLADNPDPSRGWVWQPAAVGVLVVAALAVFFLVHDIERKGAQAPSVGPAALAKAPARPRGVAGDVRESGALAGQERQPGGLEQQQALAAREDHLPRPTDETRVGAQHEPLPEDLPAELLAKPDLFVDYGMMVRLDALENFDHVQSLPDNDGLGAKQPG